MKKVKLSDVVMQIDLEVVNRSSDYESITMETADMNRPGLQIAGYMEDFPYKRLQVIGRVEHNYYSALPEKVRYERFNNFYPMTSSFDFARGLDITDDILELSQKYDRTVLQSTHHDLIAE